MSRRKQAKPRSLKPEEDEWNEDDQKNKNDTKEELDKETDEEFHDGADEEKMEKAASFVEESIEENEVKESQNTSEPCETEDMTVDDMADIKSESMDSFESGERTFINFATKQGLVIINTP